MMHGLLHAVAALIVLPYALLAGGFLVIGEMAGARDLPAVFDVLLGHADWMLGWGIYVAPVAWCVLVVAGFVPALRRAGSLALTLLSAGSLATILALSATRVGAGELAFLLPCALVLVASAAMLVRSWAIEYSVASR